MRIIITHKGEEELFSDLKPNNIFPHSRNEEIIIKNNLCVTKKPLSKMKVVNNSNHRQSLLNNKMKEISINQKRVQIPKNLADKYTNNPSRIESYLPSLPMHMINKTTTSFESSNNNYLKETFTLRNIITDDTFNSLNNTIITQELMRDKLSVIDESKFRSTYQPKTKIELMHEKLEKVIDSDKIYVIQYLNNKKNISQNFIDKLNKLNDEELQKMNRISQKVIRNEDSEKIFNNIIKEKLLFRKQKDVIDAKKTIAELDQNIFLLHMDKKNYKSKHDKKLIFHNRHMDLKKIWAKYNAEKLSRPRLEPKNIEINESSILLNNRESSIIKHKKY